MKDEIIIYQADEGTTRLEVKIENETVWLNMEQISLLFGRDRTVINRHINNIFKEGELIKKEVCAIFAHTTQHGAIKEKSQTNNLDYFNLDVIISVGYRVKSKQGTQFRIWANKVLKDYLLKGYAVSQRFERIENDVHYLKTKVEEFDFQIQTNLPTKEGIFFEGQVFDALPKAKLDLKKYRSQYPDIQINQFTKSHDRFIIIDRKTIYHLGASLKDLGKRWFAFSILNFEVQDIINKLEENQIK